MQTALLREFGKSLGFTAGCRRRLLHYNVLPVFQGQSHQR
jgi:hypothetical protein